MPTGSFGCRTTLASIVVYLVLAVHAQPPAPGDQYDLHPICSKIVTVSPTSAIQSFTSVDTSLLAISCFSWSLLATSGTTCVQSDLDAPRVVLDVGSTASLGAVSVDLGGLYAGSLYGSVFSFSERRHFTFNLLFPAISRCTATLRYTLAASYSKSPTATQAPFVVTAYPLLMKKNDPYAITFQSPTPMDAAAVAATQVAVVHTSQSCRNDAGAAWNAYQKVPTAINASFFSWTAQVANNGEYLVCIYLSADKAWADSALVTAYGGNPVYFDLRPTPSGDNVYDIEFFGVNLDATVDRFRLVDIGYHVCAEETPNSNLAVVGQLQQLSSATTTARITLKGRSAFLVCYYSNALKTWSDVPDFDAMSRTAMTNTSANSSRIGGDSSANQITSCVGAPINHANDRIGVSNTVIKLTLSVSKLPSSFSQQIATLLCLPSVDYITFVDVEKDSTRTIVYVQVICDETVCNSGERQAALWSNYKKLSQVESAESVEASLVAGSGSGSSPRGGNGDSGTSASSVVIGVVVALVVAVVIIVVLIVLVLRSRNAAVARHAAGQDVVEATVVQMQVQPAPISPHEPVYGDPQNRASYSNPTPLRREDGDVDAELGPRDRSAATVDRDPDMSPKESASSQPSTVNADDVDRL